MWSHNKQPFVLQCSIGIILFLDEPTSGLDPNTAKAIHRIIMEQKKAGTTVFLTTHNMHEAYSLCDQVALLNGGNIAESGSPEEICNRYNHQNGIVVETKDGQKKKMYNIFESVHPNLYFRCIYIEKSG